MPIDLIAAAFELIIGQGFELAKEKGKRSERILKILNAIGLKQDAPPANDFGGVYAYTLVVYGIDKPKPILEFFRHQFIKDAFWKSFEKRDSSILEEEAVNFLDWNEIGKDILAIDYDPKREFFEFRELFITSAKLTRTVQEVLVDHKLDDISGKLDEHFESLSEIMLREELSPNINLHIEGDNLGNIIVGDDNVIAEFSLIYEAVEDVNIAIEELPTKDDLTSQLTSFKDEIIEAIQSSKKTEKKIPFTLPPIDLTNFTGREGELEKLENLIFNQEGSRIVGIVGLTGSGGMGKSALAVYFANKHKKRFPDGVIGLRVDGGTVDEVARRFALHVVDKVDPNLKAPEIMQMNFQDRRMLLILDNVEDATARLLEPGGDKCAVIITTRNRSLNLGVTGQIDLNRFSLKETHDLLVSFIKDKRIEPDGVGRIHSLVGGLPLAVRIVGGALADEKETTLNEFAIRLENEKNRLYLQDPEDESLDVHASINISLKKLDEAKLYLYSSLSICAPEGFSSDTVTAVSQLGSDIVKSSLARLVKLSLLDFSEEKKRYLLHPLLFDASSELAKGKNKEVKSGDIYTQLQGRHITYFRDFSKQNKGLFSKNLNAIEKEIDELLLVAKRLIEQKNADYGFYLALEPFFQSRGFWAQAIGIIDAYLKIARDNQDWESVTQLHIQHAQFLTNTGKFSLAEQSLNNARQELKNVKSEQQASHLSAMILNSLGGIYQKQGSFKEAVDTLQQSYELLVKLNDESGQAKALNSLGGTLQRQGKFDEASDAFYKCAEIEERLGNERGQAMILNSLGGVLQRKGNFDKAADAFQKSATIEERLGNERGQAMVLNSLAGVLQRQGDFDSAVNTIRKSHQILVKLHDERGQAMVLNSLGGVLQRQGKFDEAVVEFQQSAGIEEKLKNDRGQAMVLNSLGGVLQRQGKFEEAVTAFQKSYAISEKLDDDRSLAMVLNSLGGVLQRQGKFEEAVTAFQRSLAISEKLGDERSLAMVSNSLGGVLQRQGKFEEAITIAQDSVAISNKVGDQRSIAMALNSLGGVFQRQGKFDEAITAFQKSLEISERLEDDRGQAMVLNSLGGVLQRQGKLDEASDVFQKSVHIGEEIGDLRHVAMALNSLGRVLQRRSNFDEAIKVLHRSSEIEEQLGNKRGQAMVLNSLGVLLQKQNKFDEAIVAFQRSAEIGETLRDFRHLAMVLNSLGVVFQRQGKLSASIDYFQKSINIGEKLNNYLHLSIAHFSFGKAYLEHNQPKDAVEEFMKSFEIHEKLKNIEGLNNVTPLLIRALSILGQIEVAKEFLDRALAINSDDKRLLRLSEQLIQNRQTSTTAMTKSGHVKNTIRNLSGYLYGFIIPDDASADIYFGQDQVDEEVIPKLTEGLSVWAEVEMAARGPRAKRVWLKE